jgi:hypothetical protein
MTLKSLFFKLQIEDVKRRIWTGVLAMLVFFLDLPVIAAMYLGNYNYNKEHNFGYYKLITDYIIDYLKSANVFLIIITVVGACICALSGFSFLHSRKKVDLFHSIPVRREMIFAVQYVNGILIYLIPYVVNLLLCYIIFIIYGGMSITAVQFTLTTLLINLLFFMLIYTIIIIAVLLTGNFIVSCLGAGAFLAYGPALMITKSAYFSSFFKTYYSVTSEYDMFTFLSPIGIYYRESKSNHWETKAVVLVVTLILIVFALLLYKKRPSEAAGKAMAFSISKPIIKFLLAIPLTLMGGMLFRSISSSDHTIWFIFGLAFSLLLSYAIIEIIYNFDIRSAFRHKKQLLLYAGVIILVSCVFQFDLLHYDSYLPAKANIESMSVNFQGVAQNLNMDRNMKAMKLTDIDAAYRLCQAGSKEMKTYSSDAQTENLSHSYTVRFDLKNGRTVYRNYQLYEKNNYDLMNQVYSDPKYKEGSIDIFQWKITEQGNITCNDNFNTKEFTLEKNQFEKFLTIYKDDLKTLTLDDLAAGNPLTHINIRMSVGHNFDYYVFPKFKNTIAFLKEHGFDAGKKLDVSDVKAIEVRSSQSGESKQYSSKEQLERILPSIVENEFAWNNQAVIDTETDYDVVVITKDAFENQSKNSYFFEKGKVPDFVLKVLKSDGGDKLNYNVE